jgi:hypothetical protein
MTHDVMDSVAVVVLLSVFEAVPVAVSFGLRLAEIDAVAVGDGDGESEDVEEAIGERLALGDPVLVRVADGEPDTVVDFVADGERFGVVEAEADLVEDSVAFGERELEMEPVGVREAVGVLLVETVVDAETVLVEESETVFDADSVGDAVPETVSVTLVVGVRDTVGVEVACAQKGTRGNGRSTTVASGTWCSLLAPKHHPHTHSRALSRRRSPSCCLRASSRPRTMPWPSWCVLMSLLRTGWPRLRAYWRVRTCPCPRACWTWRPCSSWSRGPRARR